MHELLQLHDPVEKQGVIKQGNDPVHQVSIYLTMCLSPTYSIALAEKRADEIVWYENLGESGEERIFVVQNTLHVVL